MEGNNHWFKQKSTKVKPKSTKATSKPRSSKQLVQPIESVLFIQYTPNSALKKTLPDLENKIKGKRDSTKVRIVERAGPTVFDLIGKRSTWKTETCGRPACTPCSGKAGSCRKLNLVYSITCQECMKDGIKAQYIGESHRT